MPLDLGDCKGNSLEAGVLAGVIGVTTMSGIFSCTTLSQGSLGSWNFPLAEDSLSQGSLHYAGSFLGPPNEGGVGQ